MSTNVRRHERQTKKGKVVVRSHKRKLLKKNQKPIIKESNSMENARKYKLETAEIFNKEFQRCIKNNREGYCVDILLPLKEDIEKLITIAEETKDYEKFRKRFTGNLMDTSNRDEHRIERAIHRSKDAPHPDLKETIDNGFFDNMKYEYRDVYFDVHAQLKEKNNHVTVYRAVPIDTPDELSLGDYVTLEERYAKSHAEYVLEGQKNIEAKVIKQDVPYTDVVYGHADLSEWAYSPRFIRTHIGSLEELHQKIHRN